MSMTRSEARLVAARAADEERIEQALTLRALRRDLGKTQVEVAALLETNQGEVSRMERRPDHALSTMRRYAEALGARCEIAFVFRGGRRVRVAVP
jgi:transcriptional regulator